MEDNKVSRNLHSEVKELIQDVEQTHRYSMSRIYGLYNKVFGTNELPQNCASCLLRKVKQLKEWTENYGKTNSTEKQ